MYSDDPIIIRRLAEEDLPALARLYVQFWSEESSLGWMQETFRRLRDDPDYIFLVADVDDEIAGSLMGIICEEIYGECRPFMVLEDVIVDREFRQQGIGSALMREVEAYAVSRNCNYIIFVSERERTDAVPFYRSLGYAPDSYRGFKKRLGTQNTRSLP
ncbi:MAG: GNAT family N-acetyltransferase [Methanoregula sp.]|jgi:ribosomal protein S18 acetylase RimI-like enzyme|uniref:GNAT family N-acetyltransferase n=1 Tax=Methanoregula sp. TaxID=2052170 RepID=UPI003C1F6021